MKRGLLNLKLLVASLLLMRYPFTSLMPHLVLCSVWENENALGLRLLTQFMPCLVPVNSPRSNGSRFASRAVCVGA